jgi:glutathione synthase/RimK-type ligase-like ATP-grasp enzyme
MKFQVMGVYREPEYSPGKIEADTAILDAVIDQLRAAGAVTTALEAASFATGEFAAPHLVLAMCQGQNGLARLAAAEETGAVVINSALAIRNCYRDLLGAGLLRAGVPVPEGVLVRTAAPLDLKPLRTIDLSSPMYVKRGDLHALGPHDVQRVEGLEQLEATLMRFARRGVQLAFVQQEVVGESVKFYGVSGGEYFATIAEGGTILSDAQKRALNHSTAIAAAALGLEVWGGDAIFKGDNFSIIDFNDWPSFSPVRAEAARAIARRSLRHLRRHPAMRDLTSA